MYAGRIVEMASKRQLFERPLHPYTETLLAAVLRPDPRLRGAHPRGGARRERAADGRHPRLRLRPPLPVRHRALPGGDARDPRGGARAPGAVPSCRGAPPDAAAAPTGSADRVSRRVTARRGRGPLTDGPLSHPAPPAHAADPVPDLGRHLRHHPAAARRLPHDADQRPRGVRRARGPPESGVPPPAVRARPADVEAVLAVGLRARPRGPGLLLRVRPAGGRHHRGAAPAHLRRLVRLDPVHLADGVPHRRVLGDAPVQLGRPRAYPDRLPRPGDAQLPARPDPDVHLVHVLRVERRRPVLARHAERALELGARVGPRSSTCGSR